MSDNPFFPQATTSSVAVTASNQNVSLSRTGTSADSIRVHVLGTQDVFLQFGGAAALATSMPIGAGHTEVFALPVDTASIGVIASATGSTIYFTLGNGI